MIIVSIFGFIVIFGCLIVDIKKPAAEGCLAKTLASRFRASFYISNFPRPVNGIPLRVIKGLFSIRDHSAK